MTHEPQGAHQDETPLEGWKEIAAYFGRTERTAKLWEKQERLPVRRQQHKLRPSVYAYPSELDAWRAARQPGVTAEPVPLWHRPLPSSSLACLLLLSLITAGDGPKAGSLTAAGITTRQVWKGETRAAYPSASYDGRFLSFINPDLELWMRDLRSGEVRRLTNHNSGGFAGWVEENKPSRNGSQVAYAWSDYSTGYDLRVVNSDGSEPRVLIPHEEQSWNMVTDWTPDGNHILAYLLDKDEKAARIVLVAATDGAVWTLKTMNLSSERVPLRGMSLSPDARYIAYDTAPQEGPEEERDIYALAVNGSGEVPLVENPGNDFVLGWAPDGSGVLFASNRSGTLAAWFIRVSEGAPLGFPVMVKPDLSVNVQPVGFTRDGTCYYAFGTTRNDLYVAELDPGTGMVLSQPSRVQLGLVGQVIQPAWSPDGQLLAYRFRGPNLPGRYGETRDTVLAIRDWQTGKERHFKLPWPIRHDNPTQWTSDSRMVQRVDVQTGDIVTREAWQEYRQKLRRPDLNARYEFLEDRIVRVDVTTGRQEELYRGGNPRAWRDISPDHRYLSFILDGAFRVLPTAGGEPRVLFKREPRMVHGRWAPDSRHYFYGKNSTGVGELWRVPVEGGGQPEKLLTMTQELHGLAVHPDGRQVALLTSEGQTVEVWVMENFLREGRGWE